MPDKYTATWVSHSSISDYLRCPRAYFLGNVYRDPNTRHKIAVISPALALGQSVHQVVESLSELPISDRFKTPLLERLNQTWQKITGDKGGFKDKSQEEHYKDRARAMLKRVEKNPGPLERLAVKIKKDLPYFWLSEPENIILCGKIDWLEYQPESKTVHVVDFKTGRGEEASDSLQLPIYTLLASECQKFPVAGVSYWYLEHSDALSEQSLPGVESSREKILAIAKKIKLARQLNRFVCPQGEQGCRWCRPLEEVLRGEGKLVGENDYHQDVYILKPNSKDNKESLIL